MSKDRNHSSDYKETRKGSAPAGTLQQTSVIPEESHELDPELDAIRRQRSFDAVRGTIRQEFAVHWLEWADDTIPPPELQHVFNTVFKPFKLFDFSIAQLGHLSPTILYTSIGLEKSQFKHAYENKLSYYAPKGSVNRSRLIELLAERDALRNQLQLVAERLDNAVFTRARRLLMAWLAESIHAIKTASDVGVPADKIVFEARTLWWNLQDCRYDFGQPPLEDIHHYWWCKRIAEPPLPKIFIRRQQTGLLYYAMLRDEILEQARPFEARRLALEHIIYHGMLDEPMPWWDEIDAHWIVREPWRTLVEYSEPVREQLRHAALYVKGKDTQDKDKLAKLWKYVESKTGIGSRTLQRNFENAEWRGKPIYERYHPEKMIPILKDMLKGYDPEDET